MNIEKFINSLSDDEKFQFENYFKIKFYNQIEKKLERGESNLPLTPTGKWMKERLDNKSIRRLYNVLTHVESRYIGHHQYEYSIPLIENEKFKFIELIDPINLIKLRGIGQLPVDEFVRLRGY